MEVYKVEEKGFEEFRWVKGNLSKCLMGRRLLGRLWKTFGRLIWKTFSVIQLPTDMEVITPVDLEQGLLIDQFLQIFDTIHPRDTSSVWNLGLHTMNISARKATWISLKMRLIVFWNLQLNTESIWKSNHGICCKAVTFLTEGICRNIMVNYWKSPVEMMTVFENIKNCHIFHLNTISQWEVSINCSNQ